VSDQIKERLAEGIFWVAALLTIGSLVVIIGYIMIQGLGQLSISFLLENPRQMGSAGGIFWKSSLTAYQVGNSSWF
jgi:phosphate transport system permease protein